ncbi:hypothetical protein [Parasphingorhabdus sp.]|uniref:hypothetical protein n=1 Tax=Parasphingorhabdus sp. TaxID=2709688 RepID=UPI003002D8A4
MKKLVTLLLCSGIAACGPAQNDPGPGGVTVGEAKALDEAAEMLDERNTAPEQVEKSGAGAPTTD